MYRILRTIVLGTLLLSAFIVIGSAPHVLAASRTGGYSPDYHPDQHYYHGDYSDNYRYGYQDGYSDCKYHAPHAYSYNEGEGIAKDTMPGISFARANAMRGISRVMRTAIRMGTTPVSKNIRVSIK